MKLPAKRPLTLPAGGPQRQRGAVLILAILIVALVAGFSIKAAREYQLSMARAEASWHGAQARAYLTGAESLAVYFLEQDDPKVDSRTEGWAQPLPPFPVQGGSILAKIDDANAKLNLNNLGDELKQNKQPTDPSRYSTAQRRFIRLLQSFSEQDPLSEDQATAIIEAIVDWMDGDSKLSGFGGAENDYYESLDTPYRPANRPFSSVEQLRLVRYITPELMRLLRPYITVLPKGQKLNVNTMNPYLVRLLNSRNSLLPLTQEQVKQVLAGAKPEYKSIDELKKNPAWDSVITAPGGLNTQGLAIKTNFFVVTTRVELGGQRRSMQSLLQRNGKSFNVLSRRDVYDYVLALERAPTQNTGPDDNNE